MISIVQVFEALRDSVKVLRMGLSDIVTPSTVLPHGVDSKPIKNQRGVVLKTRRKGRNVIVGYLLDSNITEPGESRFYSTDDDGNLKFYVHYKKDGTAEIGGDVDNMLRYLPLDAGLQAQKGLINAELVKIASAINAIVPGSYTPSPISIDISLAKIDEIKTL